MIDIREFSVEKISKNALVMKAQGHKTEFGDERTPLECYISIPQNGINKDTDILVLCLGFANDPNGPFFRKLRRLLSDGNNLIVLNPKYLGTDVVANRRIEIDFLNNNDTEEHISRLNNVSKLLDNYKNRDPKSFLVNGRGQDLSQVLKCKSISSALSKHCYIDYGYIQALDIIHSVLMARQYFKLLHSKVFGFGSSLGGYVLNMSSHFAPKLFTTLVDISSPVQIHPSYFLKGAISRGIADTFNTSISLELASFYTRSGQYKLTNDHIEVRDLTKIKLDKSNSCYYLIFAGIDDIEVTIQARLNYFKNLVSSQIDSDLIIITPREVDNDIFSHTGHSLGCNFYKLIDSLSDSLRLRTYAYNGEYFQRDIETNVYKHTVLYDDFRLSLTRHSL